MQKNSFKFGKTKTQVFVGLCMFGVKEIFRTIHVTADDVSLGLSVSKPFYETLVKTISIMDSIKKNLIFQLVKVL